MTHSLILLFAITALAGCVSPESNSGGVCADRDPFDCGEGCSPLSANFFLPEEGCWSARRPFECIPEDRACGQGYGAFGTSEGDCVQVQYSCTTQKLIDEKECSVQISQPFCGTPEAP